MEEQLSALIKDLSAAKRDIKKSGGFFPARPRGSGSDAFDGTEGGRQVSFTAVAPSTGRSRLRRAKDAVVGPEVSLAVSAVKAPRKSRASASRGGVIPQFTGSIGGAVMTGGELLGSEVVVKPSGRRPRGGVLIGKEVGAEGGVLLPSSLEVRGSGARKPNPWLEHVAKVRKAHPGMSYKECLVEAKKSY